MTSGQNDSEVVGGTLVRSADGTIYFLRDEVLEACRVTEEDAIPYLNQLIDAQEQEVSGFVLQSGAVAKSASLTGPFGSGRGVINAYTTMCAGTMSMRDSNLRVSQFNYRTNLR